LGADEGKVTEEGAVGRGKGVRTGCVDGAGRNRGFTRARAGRRAEELAHGTGDGAEEARSGGVRRLGSGVREDAAPEQIGAETGHDGLRQRDVVVAVELGQLIEVGLRQGELAEVDLEEDTEVMNVGRAFGRIGEQKIVGEEAKVGSDKADEREVGDRVRLVLERSVEFINLFGGEGVVTRDGVRQAVGKFGKVVLVQMTGDGGFGEHEGTGFEGRLGGTVGADRNTDGGLVDFAAEGDGFEFQVGGHGSSRGRSEFGSDGGHGGRRRMVVVDGRFVYVDRSHETNDFEIIL